MRFKATAFSLQPLALGGRYRVLSNIFGITVQQNYRPESTIKFSELYAIAENDVIEGAELCI
ncbi:MAG: hypothetical protein DRG35_04995 [Deltaproteobacteria bacterium]|nr:MAG: hypothetical protein DRG35_04995 [Deltaproteobacteria bacterium]